MAAQQWWFHWDNAPVHTAASVKEWMAAKGIQVLKHPPYSPDLAPADFFLFRKVKEALAGIMLDQEGRVSSGPSPPTTSPRPSGGGLSELKSAFGSAETSSRSLRK
jgi:hypothetical protein